MNTCASACVLFKDGSLAVIKHTCVQLYNILFFTVLLGVGAEVDMHSNKNIPQGKIYLYHWIMIYPHAPMNMHINSQKYAIGIICSLTINMYFKLSMKLEYLVNRLWSSWPPPPPSSFLTNSSHVKMTQKHILHYTGWRNF